MINKIIDMNRKSSYSPRELKAIRLLFEGIMTDGSHHKQWFMCNALESLGISIDDVKNQLGEDYSFDEGTVP